MTVLRTVVNSIVLMGALFEWCMCDLNAWTWVYAGTPDWWFLISFKTSRGPEQNLGTHSMSHRFQTMNSDLNLLSCNLRPVQSAAPLYNLSKVK